MNTEQVSVLSLLQWGSWPAWLMRCLGSFGRSTYWLSLECPASGGGPRPSTARGSLPSFLAALWM